MGVKGRRIVNIDEPTLLGSINDIITSAKEQGYIRGNAIDIETIIRQNGIQILYDDLPSSKSGYLKIVEGKWIIGINKNHHIHRQRYTLAHEFAHYILHRSDNNFFEDETFYRDENQTSIEYSANAFAAKLLIPEDAVEEAINKGINSINKLANLFKVSPLAMKNRIINLGYKIKSNEN